MRYLLILIFVFSFSAAQKDFYYGFINSSGAQISQKRLQEISEGFDIIKHARKLSKEGKVNEAYTQINNFKAQNQIKVLDSDIMILYAELALKKGSKRIILEASVDLENAINNSKIVEEDLARAYMILVELKLTVNKSKDAKYFANIIIKNFDNPITKAYGKIFLAKVYRHQAEYKKAIRVLYEVLTKTTDVLVATIVADELFDVYILDNQREKANELIKKVLKRNMDYYADDSFLALKKVNRLIKADMPKFAVEILKELLGRTKKKSSIEDFKYKLANTYMGMYDGTDKYLTMAKELYKDIIGDFPKGIYHKKSKMYLDEILMREGKIKPSTLSAKYKSSESMQQKILLQELLNAKKAKKFSVILKSKRIYRGISSSITKRFGYDSLYEIFDEVHIDMINQYLDEGKCFLLNKALDNSRHETLVKLIRDEKTKDNFFECVIEVPNEKIYTLTKETFNKSRDAKLYLYLERLAYALGFYNEAEGFSAKVEMVDDQKILSEEFLYRYLVLRAKEDSILLDKYFNYAFNNKQFIEDNKENPVIVDFYYQYYLYLVKIEEFDEANDILRKLYAKQNELNAHVYSPFVELELGKLEKTQNNNQKAINLLLDALNYTRRIKPNELVQVYYEITKLYESFGNQLKKEEFLNKCKDVENTKDSLYKRMCSEM